MEKFNLDIPKMGYILAVRYDRMIKKNFFSECIYQKQRRLGFGFNDSTFTHVEVLGGGPDSVCIGPPRSKAIKIDKYYKGRYVKILKPTDEFLNFETKQRYKIAYFYARLNNLAYDKRGILSFLWKWIKQNNRLFFCSEGVTWAYQKIFFDFLYGWKPNKTVPAQIVASKQLEIHWEGIIK